MTDNAPPPSENKNVHFLVVDDDPESRSTVVEYLKSLGYTNVTQAKDGSDAMGILDRDPSISFVISDWDMPLMNGLTLLQLVKTDPKRQHVPFLIITSPISQEAEKVMLAAESMVDAYLIKPFRKQVFEEKLNHMLEAKARGPQKQVVIIDDDDDARAMVMEYIKQMGFKDVIGLENGKAGLDHLSQHSEKVGLIISDWEMPDLTGIDVLRACKSNPALESIPFLMITSQSSIERMKVMQAAKASVDQYLLKPFKASEIKKRVEALIEKARSRGEVQRLLSEGISEFERSHFERARKKFESALLLDPEQDIALRNLGDIDLKLKGVEAALPHYKKAIQVNPTNVRAYLKLAAAYEQIGWIDKAIELLKTAIKEVSFSADLHCQLGKFYLKKDLLASAIQEFEKALEIQLDHQEAKVMLNMIPKRNPAKD